jgi:hypothetical protein
MQSLLRGDVAFVIEGDMDALAILPSRRLPQPIAIQR